MRDRPSAPILLLLAALAGLAVAAVWLSFRSDVVGVGAADAPEQPDRPLSPGVTLTAQPEQPEPAVLVGRGDPAPEPVRAALPPRVATDPRILGRLVDPQGRSLVGMLALRSPRAGTLPVDTHHTGNEGVFDFAVPARTAISVTMRASGRASVGTEIAGLELGQVHLLGDVVLKDGAEVTGSIRGEDGLAVADVLVELRHDPTTEFRKNLHPLRSVTARSTLGGGLHFSDPIRAGSWRVYVVGRGSTKPVRLTIAEGQRAAVLDVTAAPGASPDVITGRVADQFQRPVVGARVMGSENQGKTWPFATTTDREGGFALPRAREKKASDDPVRLRVLATHCEDADTKRTYTWGATDVGLVVTRGAAVSVLVVDAAGAPVEDFALRVFTRDCTDLDELRSRSQGWHPGGLALAYGIPAGEHLVMVEPGRRDLAQDALLKIEATGGPHTCQVVLGPMAGRGILVRGREDKPVEGATVELLLPLRGQIRSDTPARGVLDLWRAPGDAAVRIGHELTNAIGAANLRGHPDTVFTLRVKHFDYAPLVTQVTLGWSATPLEVRLPSGARLDGRILPAQVAAQVAEFGKFAQFALSLVADDAKLTPRPGKLEKDGSFAFRAIPAGDWRVEATWQQQGTRKKVNVVLARLHGLAEGETRQITIDGSDLLHSEVKYRAFVGGRPFAGGLSFQNVNETEGGRAWTIDGSGRDGARTLLPRGRWRPIIRYPPVHAKRETVSLIAGPVLELDVPRDLDLTLHTEAIPVRVRLLDKAGAPLVKRRVAISYEGVVLPDDAVTTDAEGYLVTFLAPGSYTTEYGPIDVR